MTSKLINRAFSILIFLARSTVTESLSSSLPIGWGLKIEGHFADFESNSGILAFYSP